MDPRPPTNNKLFRPVLGTVPHQIFSPASLSTRHKGVLQVARMRPASVPHMYFSSCTIVRQLLPRCELLMKQTNKKPEDNHLSPAAWPLTRSARAPACRAPRNRRRSSGGRPRRRRSAGKKTSSNNCPQKIHGDKNEKHHFDPSGEIGRGGIGGGGKCNCFSRLQTYLAHEGFSSSVELVGGLILLHCFPAHVRGFSFGKQEEGNSTNAAVEGTREGLGGGIG